MILSKVEKLCTLKPKTSRLSSYLTDWNILDASVGTEELAHMEIVSTIIHQLTKDLSMEELQASGLDQYYVDHTLGLWPQTAAGDPFSANTFQSVGDPITDLFEDMAADATTAKEQQAFTRG